MHVFGSTTAYRATKVDVFGSTTAFRATKVDPSPIPPSFSTPFLSSHSSFSLFTWNSSFSLASFQFFVKRSILLFIYTSVCVSNLSIGLSFYPSLSVRLSIYLSIICLSIYKDDLSAYKVHLLTNYYPSPPHPHHHTRTHARTHHPNLFRSGEGNVTLMPHPILF